MKKNASFGLRAALAILLAVVLHGGAAFCDDGAALVPRDRETRRQYEDLGAVGGEIIFWNGDVVEFTALEAPQQGACSALDMKLCLALVYEGAATTVDLANFKSLEYLTPKVFKLTDRHGRFYLAEHYSSQGGGAQGGGPAGECPPESTVPQANNFSLVYGVHDDITDQVVYNSVPFCRVKKLSIVWGEGGKGQAGQNGDDGEGPDGDDGEGPDAGESREN